MLVAAEPFLAVPLWVARDAGTQMAGPKLETLAIDGVQRSLTQSQSGQ